MIMILLEFYFENLTNIRGFPKMAGRFPNTQNNKKGLMAGNKGKSGGLKGFLERAQASGVVGE
jgi:hypothetical protein